jgi:hypothetical protein
VEPEDIAQDEDGELARRQGLQRGHESQGDGFGLLVAGLWAGRPAERTLQEGVVFMAGVLVFTAASLMCGLAWSPAALLAARVVQGAGAAIMTPTALSIISTTFTEGGERNKALGIWGALGGIGATAAWLIGGPLVDGPGWRWIFFIWADDLLPASSRRVRQSRTQSRLSAGSGS